MSELWIGLLVAGLMGAVTGRRVICGGRWWRIGAAALIWLAGALSLAGSGYSYWFYHRPLPGPCRESLFEGIVYERRVESFPRPLVIHIVTVSLEAKGIEFLVTPSERYAGRQLRARTTSQFLKEFGVQVAVNGSGFVPWYATGPLSYYPHVGDPVDATGLIISRGRAYSRPDPSCPTVYFSKDNRVSIGSPLEGAWNALSGMQVLVKEGEVPSRIREIDDGPQPRTALAVDRSGKTLMLFVVDGRQPSYSEGLTLAELAEMVVSSGGHDAMNLDGGGSSTLVASGQKGSARVLNTPIHGWVPTGRERPVATHLGIFAEGG